jgi:hypothetical protein
MKRWAEIYDGTVRHIFETDDNFTPVFAFPIIAVDITIEDPMPEEGWVYTGTTFSGASGPNEIWLHTNLSGGDEKTPIGILNNDTQTLTVSGTLRETNSIESNIVDVDDEWRILLRDSDGNIYDIFLVTFTNGITTFDYTTDLRPAVVIINESDFHTIDFGGTDYTVKIAEEVLFKVYRTL